MTWHVRALVLFILGCGAKGPADESGSGAGVDTADTGGGGVVSTHWLQEDAVWESAGEGYTTGGAFADVDLDGDLDLVVSSGNDMMPGGLQLYLNEAGILSSAADWTSETHRYYGHIDVGDINGDGWPDVAISRFLGDDRFDSPGGVEVYLNRGGTLPEAPDWSADGFFSFSCALGDMDGDGDLDLAVAVGEAYYNEPDVSLVFQNDGTGELGAGPVWQTEMPRHSFDVDWADLNMDGQLDLFFANSGSGHTAYLGPITDSTGPDWTAGGEGFEGNTLDLGDIDGDGRVDLAVSDNEQLGGAGVVRAWCGPELELCWTSGDRPEMQSAVSLHDVDQDGDLDLVAGSWWGPVRIYENWGGALSLEPVWASSEVETVIEAFVWGDVDGDGREDLGVTNWTPDGPNLLYSR
jgi:hypothetical protein